MKKALKKITFWKEPKEFDQFSDAINFYRDYNGSKITEYLTSIGLDPDQRVHNSRGFVNICFDYPLGRNIVLRFRNVKTVDDLAHAINEGYRHIYAIEDNQKIKLNRIVKPMPAYESIGIWGHDLEDLSVDCAVYNSRKKMYELDVSS